MPIPLDSLLEYLTGARVLSNIPDDARLVGAWLDGRKRACDDDETDKVIWLNLEHPSFKPVHPGARVPVVRAGYRKVPSGLGRAGK
jgi:hypothetical protein